jgi:tetratricopeptide (TPR) repeat protein
MLALALGLLCTAAVALGVYMIRSSRYVPSALPPLSIAEVNGTQRKTPVIDAVALTRFAQQHQLPEIPDLTRLSTEAARDIHNALEGVAARPGDAAALGHLGRVFQSHQYPAKALECYSQARALAPAAYEWAYYCGRIHAEGYEFGPAIEAYERAAQLNPDYAPTFLALGNLYLQSGDGDEARKAFRRLVALRPQSSHGYLGLAQISFDGQEYEAAIDLLSDAISRDPKDFRAHNLLGQTYQQLGQTREARYHLGIVRSLDRRDQLTKHVLFDDPLYHKVLASNSTDAALTERMRAAMGTSQPDVAIRLGEELCRRHPDDAARMNSLAEACKQAKRYTDALARAEKAISLNSSFLEAHITKAQLLMILRRNGEALKLLDWIVAQDPDSFGGCYYRGAAQVLAGQYEAAVKSFRQAVRLQDGSARAHVALAEALGETGRQAEAIEEYRRALELDPANARAIQRLRERER